ncbi:MAG: Uncharacterised protein [Opitutia bacterium UBA7350]|nr:MAG: Uncharacterised protein [Opitutae bacterium UBA7350]
MDSLNSRVFRGEVYHERLSPQGHAFTYPVTFFAFDLAEIPALAQNSLLFSHNNFGPLSLYDADYLKGQHQPIAKQLNDFIPPEETGATTLVITSPRYLGLAFNPVNFHFRMQGSRLCAAVAEVNNTFRDRHVYPLLNLENPAPHQWQAHHPKEFHVSPFNNMEGHYQFSFEIRPDTLDLRVDLHREGHCVMKTALRGQGHPITAANLWKHVLLHPADTALNSFPRIVWQAAKLTYRKKLQVFRRPVPSHPNTLHRREDREQPPSC